MKLILIMSILTTILFSNNIDKNISIDNMMDCFKDNHCKELDYMLLGSKKHYRKLLVDKLVFKILLKPTYSIKEVQRISNEKHLFSYISFLEQANYNLNINGNRAYNLYFNYFNYEKEIWKLVQQKPNDYLKPYLKIASESDGFYAEGFADAFEILLNKYPILFIKTIKDINFKPDNICAYVMTSGSFEITAYTKQIYKDNFDKNDETIKQILKCEKRIYEEYNK